MKKLILLTLSFILLSCAAMAGGLPAPPCSCELCAADLDQTCESVYEGGLLRPCATYYGIYCRG